MAALAQFRNPRNNMSTPGYYQQPTICKERIVFVCDDNLWAASSNGGIARRLTNAAAECTFPKLSPDGKLVAFIAFEEGHPEVFIMPYEGGSPLRLTYLGSQSCMVLGWKPDGSKIIIASDSKAPFFRHQELYELSPDGREMTPLNLGHVMSYSVDNKGRAVLGRNSADPAYWKRYRGGRAGELWIDNDGRGQFRPLVKLDGNMVSPMWVKGRVYFLSDHEGIGNIYSCKADGRDVQRHTHHSEYYVRYPSTDGERIIYSSAGNIHVLDCNTGTINVLNLQASSQERHTARKFVDTGYYLDSYSLNPKGNSVGLISRGQIFTMPLFQGPCLQHGSGSEVRHRLFEWLPDGETFVAVDDADNYERIALHSSSDVSRKPEYITTEDIGRVSSLEVSPHGKWLAVTNHRFELMLVDVEKKKTYMVDKSPAERISHLSWSPDSRWLAYTYFHHSNNSVIKVLDSTNYKTHEITRPVRVDFSACFDPEGKYLYFLSNREFKPVYDTQSFDLSFPQSTRPYVIPLTKEIASPFAPDTRPFIRKDNPAPASSTTTETQSSKANAQSKTAATAATKSKRKGKEAEKQEDSSEQGWVKIDFDGILDRVIAFPFSEGVYSSLCALRGRILFLSFPMRSLPRDYNWDDAAPNAASLIVYDFADQKTAVLQTGLYSMRLGSDNQTVIYRSRERLRVIDGFQSSSKGPDGHSETPGRNTGFIDLNRCNVMVEPRKEWAQMYAEAWRLQRDHFWDEKMSAVDWDLVYERYAVLLEKIRTRSELSDLLWEMQGELGTSHAYEFGGDKPSPRPYYKGFLGCDLQYDPKSQGYKITKILRGDSWERDADSPLAEPGLGIENGDIIVGVNGRRTSKDCSVDELLIKAGASHVQLTVKRGDTQRSVTVRTMHSERYLRYRNWVETNRRIVSKATNDKVGYVHIPDMGPFGFAEFHRSYLTEFHHDGLIIDVRYNRGGHISNLLLEKLLRKRIGYDVSRWGQPQPYPGESPAGPIVGLTNQFAGSDGDIFSHCFKVYEIGPLVGKRTWGGVIGIEPRSRLVDASLTTQPEYSFWFQDVGWSVENYGTEPTYEVDYRPQDYKAGKDPQLQKAIDLVLAALRKNPVNLPSFKERPQLPLPHLKKPLSGGNKVAMKAASKTAVKTTVKAAPKPAAKPAARPAAKSVSRPAAKTVRKKK